MGYAGIAALMAIESAASSSVRSDHAFAHLVPSGRFTLLVRLAGAIGAWGSIPAYYWRVRGGP